MSLYFNPNKVMASFKRLSSRKSKGKTGLERTSSLMYFLAFDAALKKTNQITLDFNPNKSEGKDNRRLIEIEFHRLVFLGKVEEISYQILELGKVSTDIKEPAKRISSNFLTVPLKKASEHTKEFFYPSRPSSPLIKMGQVSTGLKWGMQIHHDWVKNLPNFFTEIIGSTPFTDLAIFVVRDSTLPSTVTDYIDALSVALEQRFTKGLSDFWIQRIRKERVFIKHISNLFANSYQNIVKILSASGPQTMEGEIESMKKRISYLESLLKKHNIAFNS